MLRILLAPAVIAASSMACISSSNAEKFPIYDVEQFCNRLQRPSRDDPQGLLSRNICIGQEQRAHDHAELNWNQLGEPAQRACINAVSLANSTGVNWKYEYLARCVTQAIHMMQIEQDKREKRDFHY
jgi:hypothetical protein